MTQNTASNVVRFPASKAAKLKTCPHCGTVTDTRRIGRLLWAYCDVHEARWVARDFGETPAHESAAAVTQSVEMLARYAEVSG